MQHHPIKQKLSSCVAVAGASIAILAGFFITYHAYAGNKGGANVSTDGGYTSSSPSCDAAEYWSTCTGAAWKRGDVGGSNSISIPAKNGVQGGTLKDCDKVGATEYYYLGMVSKKNSSLTYGVIQVGKLKAAWGGSGIVEYNTSVGENLSTVKNNWSLANDKYGPLPAWTSTSMFCWNPGWAEAESKFKIYSKVQAEGDEAFKGSDGTGEGILEKTTTEETYTAHFFHRIVYNSGLEDAEATDTIPEVGTTYTITTSQGESLITSGNTPFGPTKYVVSNPREGAQSDELGSVDITFNVPNDAAGAKVCRKGTIDVETMKFEASGSTYSITETTGPAEAEVCIHVVRSDEGNGEFKSHSKASANGVTADADDMTNDTKEVEVEADVSSINVDFEHKMRYEGAEYDGATSDWSVTGDGSPNPPSGSFSSSDPETVVSTSSVTVNLPNEGDEKKVCQKISYNPKFVTFTSTGGTAGTPTTSGDGWSEACIKVKRKTSEPETGEMEFPIWTSSEATGVVAAGDIPSGYEVPNVSSQNNPNVYSDIYFSTDQPSVNINTYKHFIEADSHLTDATTITPTDTTPPENYHPEKNYFTTGTVSVNYTITNEGGTTPSYTSPVSLTSAKVQVSDNAQTLNLPIGAEQHICQTTKLTQDKIKLSYELKNANDPTKPIYGSAPPIYNPFTGAFMGYGTPPIIGYEQLYYYAYTPSQQGGTRQSTVCVGAIRPDTKPTDATAVSTADRMYVGETTDSNWNGKATVIAYGARQVDKYQLDFLDVKVVQEYNESLLSGASTVDHHNYDEAHVFYGNQLNTRWHQAGPSNNTPISSPDMSPYETDTQLLTASNFNVPDYTGDKICAAVGVHFKYFVSRSSSQGSFDWQPEPNTSVAKPYWVVYNAACGYIAKKPTYNVINGGIFTGGSINTSLAPRVPSGPANVGIAYNSVERTFGSWGEHLAVANGAISQFSSGSALNASSLITVNMPEISPLTIQNTGSYGNAGIKSVLEPSYTFKNRLISYMTNSDASEVFDVSEVTSGSPAASIGTTTIYTGSTITIKNDIITEGSAQFINRLPQKVIIATGDVTITNDVKQIDAWIIAGGKVHTCVDGSGSDAFKKDNNASTDAQTRGENYSTNAHCDNPLTVNGPILASDIALDRTFGSDNVSYGSHGLSSDRQTPAETFDLPGSAYLWAYAQAGRYKSSYTEAYSRELPPRY